MKRHGAKLLVVALGWLMLAGSLSACEPERRETEILEFDENVRQVSFAVDSGKVKVFGSHRVSTFWLERWTNEANTVRMTRAEVEADHLHVEARCAEGRPCHVEYDLTMPVETFVDVILGRGDVDVLRSGEDLEVTVGRGNVEGRELLSPETVIRVNEGDVDLRFDKRPELVDVRVGKGNIRIEVPHFRYRCEFDLEAENLERHGLDCHSLVSQILRLETGDGRIKVISVD